jgi:hypothetical protein
MKSLASMIGWLLLLAVLAVPSFMFYSWWTKNKQQTSSEITQEQVSSNVFTSSEKIRPAPEPAPVSADLIPPQTAGQPEPLPQAAATAALVSTAAVQPLPASAGAVPAVFLSTRSRQVSFYSPKADRDPTLSTADYSRMREAEMRRLENERVQRLSAGHRELQFESRLRLQGIVGNAAIINGEMYSTGQMIYGAKILKIGPNYVICEYKGRKFRKVLR